jgi:sentrin-specific protease 1
VILVGKDIFNLNKIIFPINQNNQHWTIAVVFMQEHKIQYYDSLGGSGKHYLHTLLRYLQDEHLDKKRTPMPSPELWNLVPCTEDTPRQLNGYDCGAFTCMFADFISMDRSFDGFDANRDMLLYREHIALSIIDGQIVS